MAAKKATPQEKETTSQADLATDQAAGQEAAVQAPADAEEKKDSQLEKRSGTDGEQKDPGPSPAKEETMAQNKKAAEATEKELLTLEELGARFRVADWRRAALARLMNWAPGKQVSEAEYARALELLDRRPQGGGRR